MKSCYFASCSKCSQKYNCKYSTYLPLLPAPPKPPTFVKPNPQHKEKKSLSSSILELFTLAQNPNEVEILKEAHEKLFKLEKERNSY